MLTPPTRWVLALLVLLGFAPHAQAQTPLVSESFESGFGAFTVVNSASATANLNRWYTGTLAGATQGANAAFISENTGAAYTYLITNTSTSHLYTTVTLPAGQTVLQVAFDWKAAGESDPDGVFDYLQVFSAPDTYTPTAGTLPAGAGVVPVSPYLLNQGTAFTRSTFAVNVGSGARRLIFTWRNDANTGTQPPAALDNVVITSRAAGTPLSGTYTINNTLPTAGTNFASFTEAITALNLEGISAPVTFNVSNGQVFGENPPALNTITSTATNTITFKEATLTPTDLTDNPSIRPVGGPSATDAGITITSTDYVTFDGINVVTATTTSLEYGYLVRNTATDGAQNVIIRNARIALNRVLTGSVGVFQTSSTTGGGASATASPGGVNRFNQYHNLTIENVYKGIYLLTGNTAASAYDDNTQVYNNTIGGATAGDIGGAGTSTSGIQVVRQNNLRVYNNEIRNVSATTTLYGIFIDDSFGASSVYNNRIHDLRNTSATTTTILYGISATTDDVATTAHTLTIYNNFVYNLLHGFTGTASATRRVIGINLEAGGDANNSRTNIYYNSVRLEMDAAYTASSTAFESGATTTGTIVTLRNNIFANYSVAPAAATAARHSAISSSSATLFGRAGSTSDFNDLYSLNVVGRGATTDYTNLAAWRAAYPGYGAGGTVNIDNSSVSVDPLFASATDLHIQSTSPVRGIGQAVTGVTTDIDGEARKPTPDLGGDEVPALGVDVAATAINGPAAAFVAGARPVTVTIVNVGTAAISAVQVSYTFNGVTTNLGTITLPTPLAAGATTTVSLGNLTFVDGNNTISATVTTPGDTDANNNTFGPASFRSGLSGAYTINSLLTTTGRNFASFTDAATALNAGGVTGAVTFAVSNGPYTEQISLGQIAGASATNTIVFNGNRRTIQFGSNDASQRAVIRLDGTDFVTLNNLRIDATVGGTSTATYGWGVHLLNGADDNRITNSTIISNNTSTSTTNYMGIIAVNSNTSVTTAGNAANRLVIEGDSVLGGYRGVALYGSTTAQNTGNAVTNSVIRDFYADGIQLYGQSGPRVIGNDISRPTRTPVTAFTGISVEGSTRGAAIERNRMHDSFNGNTASTAAGYGLYITASDGVAGQENDFVNNLVYNFNGSGTEYGIYNASSNFARYYHNTVSLDNQAATGATQTTYGFYQTTLSTDIEVLNNVFSVTRTGGTGDKVALGFNTTTSTITSNYNDLYVGTGSGYFTGSLGTADYATLTTWQAATPHDDNSVQVDPRFAAPLAGNYAPTDAQLNGTGTAATLARVPRDIANVTRTSPPDMGAYEFTPMPNDVAVVSIDSPGATALPGNNPLVVTIRNGGLNPLTTVTLTYTLNGGTPVSQVFTGLNVASGATQQLTFPGGINVTISGSNTLTVTGSLPNGQPDGNAANNVQTITFNQPTPLNDEPCAAVTLSIASVMGSNSGASTSIQPGIVLPACSPSQSPRDVWFATTVAAGDNALRLSLTGNPSGMVRVFSAPSCSAGPFTQVFCQSSGLSDTSVGTVTVPGLTAGQRYYVAVSGYGSSDAPGTFSITATSLVVTGTRPSADAELTVFPNPSATGQLTLRLAGPTGPGSIELLNALGQLVRQQPLVGTGEQQVSTQGLAAGFYTLRVQHGHDVLTRKVVLQ